MNEEQTPYLKPFSKAWWGNFWYYYKWFIIIGAVLLISLIMLLTECAHSTKTSDFTLTYIGNVFGMGQIQAFELEDRFASVTKDMNHDGTTDAKVNVVYIDTGSQDQSVNYTMADVELTGGDAVVYLFTQEAMDRYARYGFLDLSQYVQEFGIKEELLKRYDDGSVYAIEMKENPIFSQLDSIETEGLYLLVRPPRDNEASGRKKEYYDNGLEMARYIISGGANAY